MKSFGKKHVNASQTRLDAGSIAIVEYGDVVREAVNQTNLTFGERGARRSHHILHAALVHGNDVRVAFHQIGAAGTHNGGLGLKKPIEFPTFGVDWAFGRIDILGQLLVRTQDAAAESHNLARDCVDRENDAAVEAVHQLFAFLRPVAQSRLHEVILVEPVCQCRLGEGRALHGGKAEVELGNGIVAEAAGAEVGHALRHAVHTGVQCILEESVDPFIHGKHALARALCHAFLIRHFLILDFDSYASSQPFDGFGISHLLQFHHEADRVAAFATRKALAQLACR